MPQQLILKSASKSRPSGEWNEDDYDVVADGLVVGRIFSRRHHPRASSLPQCGPQVLGANLKCSESRRRADHSASRERRASVSRASRTSSRRTTSACYGPDCGRHDQRSGTRTSPRLRELFVPLLGAHRLLADAVHGLDFDLVVEHAEVAPDRDQRLHGGLALLLINVSPITHKCPSENILNPLNRL